MPPSAIFLHPNNPSLKQPPKPIPLPLLNINLLIELSIPKDDRQFASEIIFEIIDLFSAKTGLQKLSQMKSTKKFKDQICK
jgi:hypothetical protein